MKKTILITGASSGFGRLTAEALAKAGYTVFASMRETKGRYAPEVKKIEEFSKKQGVDLRALELDVLSEESVSAAVAKVLAKPGALMSLFTMPATWCSARPKPSRRTNLLSFTTSTC